MERKNIVTGISLILFFLLMGAYLESQLGAGLVWKSSPRHGFWKVAHIHGLGFGILNILYGLCLKNYVKSGSGPAQIGSYLAVCGLIMPLGFFLAGFQTDLKMIVPIGGVSMIAAWGIMAFLVMAKK